MFSYIFKPLFFACLLLVPPLLDFSAISVVFYVFAVSIFYLRSSRGRDALFFSFWAIAVLFPVGFWAVHSLAPPSFSSFLISLALVTPGIAMMAVWLGLVNFAFREKKLFHNIFYFSLLFLVSAVFLAFFSFFEFGLKIVPLWMAVWVLTAESFSFAGERGFRFWAISAILALLFVEIFWAVSLLFLGIANSALLSALAGFFLFEIVLLREKGDLTSRMLFARATAFVSVAVLAFTVSNLLV